MNLAYKLWLMDCYDTIFGLLLRYKLWLEYEFGSLLLCDNFGLLIVGYKIWVCVM
jgi:hypothetical protein